MGTFGSTFVRDWPVWLPLLLLLSPFRPKAHLHKLLLQPSSGRKAKILKMAAMQVIYILWQVRAQVLIFVPIFLLPPSLTVLCSSQK